MAKIKRDKADAVFSTYVREKANWTCRRCLKEYIPPTRALHASHFQGRGKEATRFDLDNVDALCHGCHQYFTSYPGEHYEWQVKIKGQKLVDSIILKSNSYCKKDRDTVHKKWKKELEKLIKEKK